MLLRTDSFKPLLMVLILILSSCSKTDLILPESDQIDEAPMISLPLNPEVRIGVKNGRYVFKDLSQVKKIFADFSKMTDDEIFVWQRTTGVHSSWKAYYDLLDIVENMDSEKDVITYLNNFAGKYTYSQGNVIPEIDHRSLGLIADQEGKFYIGNELQALKNGIYFRVPAGPGEDENMSKAYLKQEDDELNNIYVRKLFPDHLNQQKTVHCDCSNNSAPLSCEDEVTDPDRRRRLRTKVDAYCLSAFQSPTLTSNEYFLEVKLEFREKAGFIWRRTWDKFIVSGAVGGVGVMDLSCLPANSTTFPPRHSFDIYTITPSVADWEFPFGGEPDTPLEGFFSDRECDYFIDFVDDIKIDRKDGNPNGLMTISNCP